MGSPSQRVVTMRFTLLIICYLTTSVLSSNVTDIREKRQFSLFSIVSFSNLECNSSTTSTTSGTCYTSSECASRSGNAEGNCAAGFGVCCVIAKTACGSTISTNTSYIRNPGYPSSYTPTTTGTCTYTIEKFSDDICQLRLDFQSMSGHVVGASGVCTDSFAAAGQTGKNPPSICGTNSGYHMYVEFGTQSTDTITLTNTWASLTAKNYNILARQIPCTAEYRAPTDCVQYFTGTAGSVQSYNFQGGKYLQNQIYTNCIRTEQGYCKIQWKESSSPTPDPFTIGGNAAIEATGCTELISIPNLSPDRVSAITIPTGVVEYQTEVCGPNFGIEGSAVAQSLVSAKQPFVLGVQFGTGSPATATGFNMDYTQLAC